MSERHRLALIVLTVTLVAAPRAHAEAGPKTPKAAVAAPMADDEAEQKFPGQLSSKFKVDDGFPEGSVPTDAEKNKNPIQFGYYLQDLLARAEEARKLKRFPALVMYYRAVAKAVPENAVSWRKLCEAYKLINDGPHAEATCKNALHTPGSELNDFVRYVEIVTAQPTSLQPDQRAELHAVADHLAAVSQDPSLSVLANRVRCQAAVKLSDVKLLEDCTQALVKTRPDDLKTVVFQWSLAVQKGEKDKAARLLERAQKLGLPKENIASMEPFTPGAHLNGRWQLWSAVGAAAVALASVLGAWLAKRRRAFPQQPQATT